MTDEERDKEAKRKLHLAELSLCSSITRNISKYEIMKDLEKPPNKREILRQLDTKAQNKILTDFKSHINNNGFYQVCAVCGCCDHSAHPRITKDMTRAINDLPDIIHCNEAVYKKMSKLERSTRHIIELTPGGPKQYFY